MRPILLLVPLVLLVAACSGSPGASPPEAGSASPSAAAPTPLPSLGATRPDPAGVEQVWVPAGTFQMGTDEAAIAELSAADPPPWVASEFPSEQPQHEVTLSTGYWIDRTEVTNEAFDAFVAAGGYTTQDYWSDDGWAWVSKLEADRLPRRCPGDAPDVPRRCINWFEASAYAAWRGGALPTEAEWEFAARGPESPVYPWGDDWDPARANVVDSTGAVAVGSYPDGASWVGALDLSGNAMEWVADWLGPHPDGPVTDPTGAAAGTVKVEKGGWWGSNEFVARSAYRHYEDPPDYQDKHIGFRVVSR